MRLQILNSELLPPLYQKEKIAEGIYCIKNVDKYNFFIHYYDSFYNALMKKRLLPVLTLSAAAFLSGESSEKNRQYPSEIFQTSIPIEFKGITEGARGEVGDVMKKPDPEAAREVGSEVLRVLIEGGFFG